MREDLDKRTKRIAIDGMLCAIAIIFGYIETVIPINFGVPGIKLGLANVVILFAITTYRPVDAIMISIIRVMVVGFLFGNLNSIIFSLAGAIGSLCIMWFINKFQNVHIIIVSLFGAVFHIVGQLGIGIMWYPIKVLMYYGLFLLVAAVVTGIINGMIVDMVKRCIYNKLI